MARARFRQGTRASENAGLRIVDLGKKFRCTSHDQDPAIIQYRCGPALSWHGHGASSRKGLTARIVDLSRTKFLSRKIFATGDENATIVQQRLCSVYGIRNRRARVRKGAVLLGRTCWDGD